MVLNTNSGPSIWTVSDGRAGNHAQIRALRAALSEASRWQSVEHIQAEAHRTQALTLRPRAPWTYLPGAHWPLARLALPKADRDTLSPPWPSLWIAAGRRSAPYTAAIRKWSKGRTLTVQILDPKRQPADFNLVVVPEHDTLDAPNVLRIPGSLTHFSQAELEAARQRAAQQADHQTKTALILLGGHSKTHRFTQEDADRLETQLRALHRQGWALRLTSSRRTPQAIAEQFRHMAASMNGQFWAGPADGDNPYLSWLVGSDIAIATQDSANMLSEVAWHGLPLHIAKLSGPQSKLDRFYDSLITARAARWFDGTASDWTYPPLRTADKVADRVVHMLLERQSEIQAQVSIRG